MMTTLIYSHTSLWPIHNAESLELAKSALERGNDVYWLQCEGELASCPANPKHLPMNCAQCNLRSSEVRRNFLDEAIKYETLRLRHVPARVDEVNSLELLRDFTFDGAPLGELVLSQLVDNAKDLIIPNSVVASQGRPLLQNAVDLYVASLNYIQEREIDEVYVWNGRRPSDGPVLWAAKKLGISFYAHITGGSREWLLVVPATKVHDRKASSELRNQIIADAQQKLGISALRAQGEDYFSRNRNGTLETIGYRHWRLSPGTTGLKTRKTFFVYFSNSPFERGFMSDWADGFSDADNQFELLAKLHDFLPEKMRTRFTVRWHPNMRNAGPGLQIALEQCIRVTPRFFHVLPGSDLDSYSLLQEAKVVVSNGSTMGIEATLFGKVSILVGVAGYSGTGGVYEAHSAEGLMTLLKSSLVPKKREIAQEYGYYLARLGNYRTKHVVWQKDGKIFHQGTRFDELRGFVAIKIRILRLLDKVWRRFR